MSHTVEVMKLLQARGRIQLTEEQLASVQYEANMQINLRNAEWFERFLSKLGECTGKTADTLQQEIARHAGLTDAMKYIQLGNPESIVLVREHPMDIVAKLATNLSLNDM